MFDPDKFKGECCETKAQLCDWMQTMKDIIDELKQIGDNKGLEALLQLAMKTCKLTMPPDHSQFPVCLNDILEIVADQNWHNDCKEHKLTIVHDMVYGMFQTGKNIWAMNAEREWLSSKNIGHNTQFEARTLKTDGATHRQQSGFAIKHVTRRFSDTPGSCMQAMMRKHHKEWLSVRINPKKI